jgi:RNase P/RNase MRP subunit p30
MERIILEEKNFNCLREIIKKNKGKEIIFKSNDDNLNRKVAEKLEVSGILIPLFERKDYMKQRNSGFNQVIAKILAKKNIFLGVDFDEIVFSKQKDKIFSRLKQNIFLSKKYKVQIKFILGKEKRDIYSLKSFGLVLGMPTYMLKELN